MIDGVKSAHVEAKTEACDVKTRRFRSTNEVMKNNQDLVGENYFFSLSLLRS